ncbi:hypothetical protein LENED_003038 [Lentinula edodes]|uniref:Uncharacterized protein n=1 Tax=Lentinula edodes TaxID=5353 RepID=A0A1Q3E2I4_LENED|nr:hypothetical protein LENED_003038 [Lentinula edodes]
METPTRPFTVHDVFLSSCEQSIRFGLHGHFFPLDAPNFVPQLTLLGLPIQILQMYYYMLCCTIMTIMPLNIHGLCIFFPALGSEMVACGG